jgi:hypothetical protein
MPAELELAIHARQWGALPESGGLLDQPFGLLDRMSASLNAYNALVSEQSRGDLTLTEWSKRNPGAWRILARVEKLRRQRENNGET